MELIWRCFSCAAWANRRLQIAKYGANLVYQCESSALDQENADPYFFDHQTVRDGIMDKQIRN